MKPIGEKLGREREHFLEILKIHVDDIIQPLVADGVPMYWWVPLYWWVPMYWWVSMYW